MGVTYPLDKVWKRSLGYLSLVAQVTSEPAKPNRAHAAPMLGHF